MVICVLRFLKILLSGRLYFLLTICTKINLNDEGPQEADKPNEEDLRGNSQTDEVDQLSQNKIIEEWNWDKREPVESINIYDLLVTIVQIYIVHNM